MKITTKKGDDGTTGLLFGGRVPKDGDRPTAYGEVDEAQATLGVVRAQAEPELADVVLHVQRDLWVVMAELATAPENAGKLTDGQNRTTQAMVDALDETMDAFATRFEPPTEFVVPGESAVAAALDVSRTVVRRAERAAVAALRDEESWAVPYLNRLSDLLWTLARWQEGESPNDEVGDLMIEFSLATEATDGDVRVTGLTAEGVSGAPDGLDAHLADRGFEGDLGVTVWVPGDDGSRLFVGLGKADDLGPRAVRRAAAGAARVLGKHAAVATTLLSDAGLADAAGARALVEGFALGAYRFTEYKSDPEPHQLEAVRVLDDGDGVADGLARGAAIAAAVNAARDLVNEPGGVLTPPVFAERAEALVAPTGVTVEVLDKAAIEAAGFGGLLGVNRGSLHEPRFVRMTHAPEGATAHVVLVGKGITFDAGGLSIKTADGMVGMNGDMGGGAAVIGAMSAVAELAPGVKVTGLVPMTDNMLGPDATRPGDVLTIADGGTVEVLNTDAEGRLILADGLVVASREEPDAIIDLATLTGACMVALGGKIAGLMGNDDDLVTRIEGAAEAAGERVWHLPLPADYAKEIESSVADVKNIGKRWGGALTAGLFLQHFVGDDIPWCHLDIAGPAWLDDADGENPKNGTGFGVRTLLELLSSWS